MVVGSVAQRDLVPAVLAAVLVSPVDVYTAELGWLLVALERPEKSDYSRHLEDQVY